MWRSFVFGLISIPFALIGLAVGWIAKDWKVGFYCMMGVFTAFMMAAIINLLFVKKMSTVDVFLPIPVGVLWGVVLIPFSLGTEIFSLPALIGAAILFTMSLWFYKAGRFPRYALIFPALIYGYEMMPVNIPGPIDDYLGLGGEGAVFLLQYYFGQVRRDTLGAGGAPAEKLPEGKAEKVVSIENASEEKKS